MHTETAKGLGIAKNNTYLQRRQAPEPGGAILQRSKKARVKQ